MGLLNRLLVRIGLIAPPLTREQLRKKIDDYFQAELALAKKYGRPNPRFTIFGATLAVGADYFEVVGVFNELVLAKTLRVAIDDVEREAGFVPYVLTVPTV